MKKIKLNEIFFSLQGEAANAGMPAIFIRFAGCNLECDFCDTDHSCKFEMTVEEVIEEIKQYNCKNVVLTGGDPTFQMERFEALAEQLKYNGYYVCLETNGTRDFTTLGVDFITVSPKQKKIIKLTGLIDEVKVVYEGQDLEQYFKIKADRYYLQPCDVKGVMNTAETIAKIKEDPRWRLSFQLQKVIGIR